MLDLNKLPDEVVKHSILPYLYQTCKYCNKNHFFFDFTSNVTMKKYVSIFDDNFYFQGEEGEIHYFDILCNKCYKEFLDDSYFRLKK